MDLRYFAEIEGELWSLMLSQESEGLTVAGVNEDGSPEPPRAASLSLVQTPGVYSMILDGYSYEVFVQPDPDQPHMYQVTLGRWRFKVQVQTERERRLAKVAAQKAVHTGAVTVKAPMPGLVQQVNVLVGDVVAEGQRLLVLEAMKMENDIQAPRAGRVTAVHVRAGDTVDSGRLLAELD